MIVNPTHIKKIALSLLSHDEIYLILVMSLQVGIVGLPNVEKSTIFNALTESGIPAENYPFCTIDPNVGIVEVPDHRLINFPVFLILKKQYQLPSNL